MTELEQSVRATPDDKQVLAQRLHERHQEYRQRRMELELAASGIRPTGIDPRSPPAGGQAFVDSLKDVDIDAALEAIDQIHTQGYAIAPLLPMDVVVRIRDELAPLFDDCARLFSNSPGNALGENQTIHVQNVLAKSAAADEVACLPLLRAIVAGVLGYDYVLNAGVIAMSPDPGCDPQGLHRDDGFFALIPRPHMPLVVTVAVALDPFVTANGATQMVPGSCLWPDYKVPAGQDVMTCEMPAGSMLIWDGANYHGGGGNRTSDQSRRTLTLNYSRGWLRTQFNQYLSVPRRRVLQMPKELQKDLGYHRSALGLGGCDHQDPLRYLQRLETAGGDGHQNKLGG